MQRREFQQKGRARPAAREYGDEQRNSHPQCVQEQHGEEGIVKKGRGEREIDGQFCAARDIGQAQNGAALDTPVVQPARGENGGGGTAEPHDEGEDRSAVEPGSGKDAVRQRGEAGEEAALLQYDEKEKEKRDLRQES